MGTVCSSQAAASLDGEVSLTTTYGPAYRKNVMFLCNHNSCRSQMADGWLRQLRGTANIGVASAGIVGGTAVKEGAITVMKEAGVDISGFTSDAMADFRPEDFDVVISCCGCGDKLDGEKEVWKKRPLFMDWNLDDPPAIDPGDLSAYKRVRDECKAKVEELLAALEKPYGKHYSKNVMFLCNHNSCRSQMADGWLRELRANASVGVASAGIVGGTAVKEGAISVMGDAGMDISKFTSDAMADFNPEDFDVVISCCGCGDKLDGDKEVWKKRPIFQDWNLDDPPAIDPGDLSAYKRVRDECKAKVEELLATLAKPYGKHYSKNVMFLCNHNSCRSQMADGWMQALRGRASVGVVSAGIVGGTAVKEGAITVMKDANVDISKFTSDAMADFNPEDFDVVISCCGCGDKLNGDKEAWKKRPVFQDWNLDDPPAIDPGDLSAYKRVRDESRVKVKELLQLLDAPAAPMPLPYGKHYEKNVMFLCNHNSCRSQMADGWLRELRKDFPVGVASAGIVGGTAVKEGAITVMKEAGVDISKFTSDAMADFNPEDFDVVISCCGCGDKLDGDKEVWKKRPIFQDWNLDDPPAIDPGDLSAYKRVRDECKAKVEELLATLAKPYGKHYSKNVMFLCNHNSCRSQMADGWMQALRGRASVGVVSAGIVGGTAVKEGAITVMKDANVDISKFTSDAMADFNPEDFDVVISCCGCGDKLNGDKEAWKKRPVFQDWNLDDPPAIDPGDLSAYKRVRDESRVKVKELLQLLDAPAAPMPLPYGKHYEKNVMFLCNHNSCRSQMADGWLRELRKDFPVGVASAGIVGGTAVKEGAITVMKEAGVDISKFTSDAMADFNPEDFDVVISCCGCGDKLNGDKEVWKKRPIFQDWNLDDPPAIDPGDLSAYKRVRDECKAKVLELLDTLF